MKYYFTILLLATALISCNNEPKKDNTKKAETTEVKAETVLTVDQLIAQKEKLTDKEVIFKGTVDHVCKHSGKRAFVFGSTEDIRIKIVAGGEIRGFDADLIGSDIQVKGILKELRIDEAYINQMEDNLKKDHDGEGKGEEHEDKEENLKKVDQIKQLRAEIAATEKGYKSVYHIDGLSFKKVN